MRTRTQSRRTQVGSDAAEGQKQIGTSSKWIPVEETLPDQSMWSVIVLVNYIIQVYYASVEND